MSVQKTKKHISFPNTLIELAEKKANTLGFNFAEYMRYILAKEVEGLSTQYPMVSKKEEKEIGEALENIKNGDYVVVKNRKELEKYLLS